MTLLLNVVTLWVYVMATISAVFMTNHFLAVTLAWWMGLNTTLPESLGRRYYGEDASQRRSLEL